MAPLIFLLDNYDSFTYNLFQYMREMGAEVEVRRNDEISVAQIVASGCQGIMISPGPGRPEGAGITLDLIAAVAGKIPLLGVCLGHQAIGQHWGGRVVRAGRLMHGKTSAITHDGMGVFTGMPQPFEATRYHSLVIAPESLPADLVVTATTRDDGDEVIMGVRHRDWPRIAVEGVQFHPESILTQDGRRLVRNFLDQVAAC